MAGMTDVLLSELLDSLPVGGHSGYGTALRESDGDDGGGGIPTVSIVIVFLLAVVTVALLAGSSPRLKLKRFAPGVLLVVMMATPLLVWAGTSGGDEKTFIVERAIGRTGAPEFILSLGESELNALETTGGKRSVRVECLGRQGQVVLVAKRRWPFRNERGYEYPHTHQRATPEQVRRADRCRLKGTRVPLEADVEGALTG